MIIKFKYKGWYNKMMVKTNYKNLALTSRYLGTKNWNAQGSNIDNWNNHRISIFNKDTKKRTNFEYWESVNKKYIDDEKSLIYAFYCFVSDCQAGMGTFEDFCMEFGDDKKTYKACKKSYDAFKRVVDEDVYEMLNDLQENYDF